MKLWHGFCVQIKSNKLNGLTQIKNLRASAKSAGKEIKSKTML